MKTCLIVDDSAVIRSIAARIVTNLGLEPKEAATPEAGLAICREKTPDVVLLDWDLPSLAALDFLRGVGEFEPDKRPPIVLCATEQDQDQFTLAKAAGAGWHVLKPFTVVSIGERFAEMGLIARESGQGHGRAAS